MQASFAESYLIDLLENHFSPQQPEEFSRGVNFALAQEPTENVEQLAAALERIGLRGHVALINLMSLPLTPLWVGAALAQAKKKIRRSANAQIVIVGLWRELRRNGRLAGLKKRFVWWRAFMEGQLLGGKLKNLNIVWVG